MVRASPMTEQLARSDPDRITPAPHGHARCAFAEFNMGWISPRMGVWRGALGRGQSFRDRRRRAGRPWPPGGAGSVKGKALQPRPMGMAVFRGFRALASVAVTISSVTIGHKWQFSVGCRLIADYAAARIGAIEVGPAGAGRGRAIARGGAPFRCAFCSTPVARIAAGLREKFLAPMSARTGRAKSAVGHGVGGQGAPALPRPARIEAEKTGPGAGKPRARTLAQRGGAAAVFDAVVAMVQGGARPFGVKGAATLCAPGLHVN